MFKLNNKTTRVTSLTCRRSVSFIVYFEHILDLFSVFLLLTLNKKNVSWVLSFDREGVREDNVKSKRSAVGSRKRRK